MTAGPGAVSLGDGVDDGGVDDAAAPTHLEPSTSPTRDMLMSLLQDDDDDFDAFLKGTGTAQAAPAAAPTGGATPVPARRPPSFTPPTTTAVDAALARRRLEELLDDSDESEGDVAPAAAPLRASLLLQTSDSGDDLLRSIEEMIGPDRGAAPEQDRPRGTSRGTASRALGSLKSAMGLSKKKPGRDRADSCDSEDSHDSTEAAPEKEAKKKRSLLRATKAALGFSKKKSASAADQSSSSAVQGGAAVAIAEEESDEDGDDTPDLSGLAGVSKKPLQTKDRSNSDHVRTLERKLAVLQAHAGLNDDELEWKIASSNTKDPYGLAKKEKEVKEAEYDRLMWERSKLEAVKRLCDDRRVTDALRDAEKAAMDAAEKRLTEPLDAADAPDAPKEEETPPADVKAAAPPPAPKPPMMDLNAAIAGRGQGLAAALAGRGGGGGGGGGGFLAALAGARLGGRGRGIGGAGGLMARAPKKAKTIASAKLGLKKVREQSLKDVEKLPVQLKEFRVVDELLGELVTLGEEHDARIDEARKGAILRRDFDRLSEEAQWAAVAHEEAKAAYETRRFARAERLKAAAAKTAEDLEVKAAAEARDEAAAAAVRAAAAAPEAMTKEAFLARRAARAQAAAVRAVVGGRSMSGSQSSGSMRSLVVDLDEPIEDFDDYQDNVLPQQPLARRKSSEQHWSEALAVAEAPKGEIGAVAEEANGAAPDDATGAASGDATGAASDAAPAQGASGAPAEAQFVIGDDDDGDESPAELKMRTVSVDDMIVKAPSVQPVEAPVEQPAEAPSEQPADEEHAEQPAGVPEQAQQPEAAADEALTAAAETSDSSVVVDEAAAAFADEAAVVDEAAVPPTEEEEEEEEEAPLAPTLSLPPRPPPAPTREDLAVLDRGFGERCGSVAARINATLEAARNSFVAVGVSLHDCEDALERWRQRERDAPNRSLALAAEEEQWREREADDNAFALALMRTLVPSAISEETPESLRLRAAHQVAKAAVKDDSEISDKRAQSLAAAWGGLYTHELAGRLKRCRPLHWVQMHIDDITTSNFLAGAGAETFKNLGDYDVIELRAIYACCPKKFDRDQTGAKAAWRAELVERLEALVSRERRDVVAAGWDGEKDCRRLVSLPAVGEKQRRSQEFHYLSTPESDAVQARYEANRLRLDDRQASHASLELRLGECREERDNAFADARSEYLQQLYGKPMLKQLAKEADDTFKSVTHDVAKMKIDLDNSIRQVASATPTEGEFLQLRKLYARHKLEAADAAADARDLAALRRRVVDRRRPAAAAAAAPAAAGVAAAYAANTGAAVVSDDDWVERWTFLQRGRLIRGPFDPWPAIERAEMDGNVVKKLSDAEEAAARKKDIEATTAARLRRQSAAAAALPPPTPSPDDPPPSALKTPRPCDVAAQQSAPRKDLAVVQPRSRRLNMLAKSPDRSQTPPGV
ncbi:hypothetical protein M885DRAFT_616140 [Pelagophyceae sp. CCMP2097]|nr:hypothetical protein M885DRAFT_616140 [Pelagophyceae sp. CCMP2097]